MVKRYGNGICEAIWSGIVGGLSINTRQCLMFPFFTDDTVYFDLIDNMPTDTWQSIVTTLLFMGVICFIFMYDTFTVIVSMLTIASVCTGILGNLSWMGVNLDPMVMAATLISIGFSIDVPAHVAYHFHKSGFEGGNNLGTAHRLRSTLDSVGFPVIQAAFSTNMCLVTLMLVPLHMAQVFSKTMILCVCLCLVHGLLVIPALLSLGTTLSCYLRQYWRRRKARKGTSTCSVTVSYTDSNSSTESLKRWWSKPKNLSLLSPFYIVFV